MNICLTVDQFDDLETHFPEFTYRNAHTDQHALVTDSSWSKSLIEHMVESKHISPGQVTEFSTSKVHMLVFVAHNNSPV